MLRYLTAGESHGKCLIVVVDGVPAGLKLSPRFIDREFVRRQTGYGRGPRMKLEQDKVEILSGIRKGETIGSPLTLCIANRDFTIDKLPAVVSPRPGHADLAGVVKYGRSDIRDILERSSARETAARVAAGAVAKLLLREFDIDIFSHVVTLGPVDASLDGLTYQEIGNRAERSSVRCADRAAGKRMMQAIDSAVKARDSLGGIFEVIVMNPPIGLGSHRQWDTRLDGQLARAVMSIQAVKGVEIGIGFGGARQQGSQVHDEICYSPRRASRCGGWYHTTNNAGGIEGGMSNGETIILRAAMKPIPTLKRPLHSVSIRTRKPAKASVERADICAVPAAGVVSEAAVAFEIASAFIEKFGGDSMAEIKRNFDGYLKQIRR